MIPVFVISTGRPSYVERTNSLFPGCRWVVPAAEADAYHKAGADVVPAPEKLQSRQCNHALSVGWAENEYVATIDDDMTKAFQRSPRREVTGTEVIEAVAFRLADSPYFAGGAWPNQPHWSPGGDVTKGRLIWLMVHRRNPITFDPNLRQLADVDYSIQHHHTYGGVLINGDYCVHFETGKQSGGIIRTTERATETIKYMTKKWGGLGCKFFDSPRMTGDVNHHIPWQKIAKSKK